MIEKVKEQVKVLLNKENSGHGMEHVNRVLNLSLKFAEIEKADKDIVALIALLHDVDDYKLVGVENANNLVNTKKILQQCPIETDIKERILKEVKTIGYSKRLNGIRPMTIEGMIVSDADMCDGIGATGIIRSYQYHLNRGDLFFDKNVYPILNLSANDYMSKTVGTVVNHMFEKLLRLKKLMMTDSGREEAIKRHNMMIEFLYHFFEEENVPEWIEYLDNYLKANEKIINKL
ncbi:MAG: HD domain-containing protein [Clostridia bacterium]|nr:HD domain-containing protein [Clostridia bacterium]